MNDSTTTIEHPDGFVDGFGPGLILNINGKAEYWRPDRGVKYPTWEGQLYIGERGYHRVVDGAWTPISSEDADRLFHEALAGSEVGA